MADAPRQLPGCADCSVTVESDGSITHESICKKQHLIKLKAKLIGLVNDVREALGEAKFGG